MNCKWEFGNAIIDTGPLEMTNPGLNGIYQASGFWELPQRGWCATQELVE